MRTLQCTYKVRNIILPFVDEIYPSVPIEDSVSIKVTSSYGKAKQIVPKLYRNTGIVTMSLCVFGFIFMFIDAILSLLGLNSSVYIIWCSCYLSLFFTNKIALADWKSINERQREISQENHNS